MTNGWIKRMKLQDTTYTHRTKGEYFKFERKVKFVTKKAVE